MGVMRHSFYVIALEYGRYYFNMLCVSNLPYSWSFARAGFYCGFFFFFPSAPFGIFREVASFFPSTSRIYKAIKPRELTTVSFLGSHGPSLVYFLPFTFQSYLLFTLFKCSGVLVVLRVRNGENVHPPRNRSLHCIFYISF